MYMELLINTMSCKKGSIDSLCAGPKYLLEICIVVKDARNEVGRTFESILNRVHGVEFGELSIRRLDGFSTDGTWEYLKSLTHVDQVFGLSISQAPPRGVYDAMNVCVKISQAEWIWFVNAGDLVLAQIKELVSKLNAADRSVNAIIGSCGLFFSRKTKFGFINKNSGLGRPHQSTVYRKSAHIKYGFYNDLYKAISDKLFLNQFMESEILASREPFAATLVSPVNMSRRPTIIAHDLNISSTEFDCKIKFRDRMRIHMYEIEGLIGFAIFTFVKSALEVIKGRGRIISIGSPIHTNDKI
jgi:hypothetical protein